MAIKKKVRSTFLFFALCGIFLSCKDDDYPYAGIPSVVRNSFWAQYPAAVEVEFYKSGENYGVEFEIDEQEGEVIFTADGKILKEKKEISYSQLPRAVRKAFYREFGNKKFDQERVSTTREIYYQAEVEQLFRDRHLVLNEAGEQDSTLTFWK